MSKILIIAEKPSVATDLARVLAKLPEFGKFDKKGQARNTYFENDTAIITSAVGHLVELKMPTTADGKKLPWSFKHLPAIPKNFELQPIERTESRYKLVVKLAKRKDVTEIVNACDAGREGELIFRYLLEAAKINKPTKRLWMRSMTQDSILEAWAALRSEDSMQPLADAAKCRSEADWLVGLNSTRALTAFRSRNGGFNITAAGRVQTPTLAILVKRELEVRNFKPDTYFEVSADFEVSAGSYSGLWFNPKFKAKDQPDYLRNNRLASEQEAQAIVERCANQVAKVSEISKESSEICPQLYDLTTLQKEASKLFGLSAKNTLSIAQSLYEKHKVLTYPRTDSRCLPEDYIGNVKSTLKSIASSDNNLADPASKALSKGWVKANKRIFNNAKISDHFAIIPTGKIAKLSELEFKVYQLVTQRFIAIFYPSAKYHNLTRTTEISHSEGVDSFKTTGKTLVEEGWREVLRVSRGGQTGAQDSLLVPIKAGENAQCESVELAAKETRPPAHYNEATLLGAMEGAGKLVEDDELREAMADRGLGTPATRAATIEGLIASKYVLREERHLRPSPQGLNLIALIDEIKINTLSSAELTGDWEYKLRLMEARQFTKENFMNEITEMTRETVAKVKSYTEELQSQKFDDLEAACPQCAETPVKQTDATYECYSDECKFRIQKFIAQHELKMAEAKTLLETKEVGPFDDFKSRFNKPFEAKLKINDKFKVEFDFGNEEDTSVADLTDDQIFARDYTISDGRIVDVYETEKSYLVPKILTGSKKDEVLKIGRNILKHEITRDEVLILLGEGKTPLIKNFVSNRTKRSFEAFLTLNFDTGKIGFDFPPREAKKSAKKKPASKKAPAKKVAKKKS